MPGQDLGVLRDLVMGQIGASMIGITARLGIVDHLTRGPRSADDIASLVGAHGPSLRRLMRALAAFDVVAEREDGRFELRPMGEYLRDDHPESVRGMAMVFGGGPHARGWAEAIHSIRTGEPVPEGIHGAGIFDQLAADPTEQAIFDRAMTENSRLLAPAIVGAYDFSRSGTIADIGGGHGTLLAEVLHATPGARGILYDAPHVIEGAPPLLEALGVADRVEPVGGDFFAEAPPGADLYMMKSIIHDWDDERAATILRNCRARLRPDGRVLVIDRVMPERITPDAPTIKASVTMDLNMLVMVSGMERTESEHRALMASAGLELVSVTPTPVGFGLIEGAPV